MDSVTPNEDAVAAALAADIQRLLDRHSLATQAAVLNERLVSVILRLSNPSVASLMAAELTVQIVREHLRESMAVKH